MKKIHYLTFLLYLLVLSSNKFFDVGIDIYETGHIHDDGSGQLEIVADLTNSEQLVQVASLLVKVAPDVVKDSIQEVFLKVADSLERVAGVSSVVTANNDKILHFKLNFQFNNIKALNEAIRTLYTHANHPGCTSFKMDHRSFARVDTQNVAQLLAHYYAQADPYIANLISKTFLNVITYHLTYRFDKKIKKATHALASISEDRKTVLLKQSLAVAQESKLYFSNTISF
jgi:hypothetical protein